MILFLRNWSIYNQNYIFPSFEIGVQCLLPVQHNADVTSINSYAQHVSLQ